MQSETSPGFIATKTAKIAILKATVVQNVSLCGLPTLDFLSRVIYDTAFQTSIRGNLFCRSISVWTGRKDPLCLLPQTLNSLVSLKSIPTVHQSGMASHPPSPQTGLMLYKHSIVQCLQLFQHSVWSQLYSITAKKKKEICFKRARA